VRLSSASCRTTSGNAKLVAEKRAVGETFQVGRQEHWHYTVPATFI
jgi:hypothetical protein